MRNKEHPRTSEAELLRYAAEGLNWIEVANVTGINAHQIRIAACVLGIKGAYLGRGPKSKVSKVSNESLQAVINAMASGKNLSRACKELGLKRSKIHYLLRSKNLPTNPYETLARNVSGATS